MKQVHEATHPSARLERRPRPPAEDVVDVIGPGAVEELLDALGAEADEDDGPAEPEDE